MTIYRDVLSHFPNDPELLTMRGVARYWVDGQQVALGDFSLAAQYGARSVWPYFFLAHAAIEKGKFSQCWKWCLRALERRAPAAVYAQLHQWLAISRFALGQPIEIVMEGFDLAEQLDPVNDVIRFNRTVIESHASQPRDAVKKVVRVQAPDREIVAMLAVPESGGEADVLSSQQRNRVAKHFEAVGAS
jgi:hypothetical protein